MAATQPIDCCQIGQHRQDENIPPEDIVLCEACAMELSGAFEFLLKVQKAEDAMERRENADLLEILDETSETAEEVSLEKATESEDSQFNMDMYIEKLPPPVEEKAAPEPPPKRRKDTKRADCDDVEYPARVVIFPQFVVCQVEPKKLLEDVAAGRISEEFLKQQHRLKMLDVTGVMISLENHRGVLQQQVIQTDEDKEDMFLCRYCPKSFSTAHHLMMHTRKSHVCQFCLQGFAKLDDLHMHIEQEHVKFECHFCPREFSCNNNLRSHLKKTHGVTLPAYVSLITVEKQSGDEEDADEAQKG
ncbi:zinc finger and BTB domain-containing protein 6-like isoform X2 [Phlebotomus argentipes]|uniref:zinc finger and BTB domain-containing protein 6-like isoform X2 n=1 Tax=Phlebotomus argentipes TaxID=94469 RepID=UPI0028934F4C|nr:zinc finger and BTB domain-containing protein 6-like isoform X2 [Phlebotomus argentipes]